MKLFIHLFSVIILLEHGASGAYKVSVMEGDSVTLHTGVEIKQQEEIKWYFNDTRIAQISGDLSTICTDVQCEDVNERFRDRLKLDHQTGSLTITNTRNTDSGVYKLLIFSSSDSETIFNVIVRGVSAAELDEVKRKEGESVTLDSGVTKNPNDVMMWYFNDTLIAEITGDQSKICTDDQCDERFRDRLKLDHQTGSLTITNTRTADEGLYKLQIIINNSSFSITTVKRFNLTVTADPDSGLSSAVPDSDLSSGVIAAIVVVGVLLVVVAVTAGVIYRCRSKNNTPAAQNENDVDGSGREQIPLNGQGEE